jgi:hypothetical protein
MLRKSADSVYALRAALTNRAKRGFPVARAVFAAERSISLSVADFAKLTAQARLFFGLSLTAG